MIPSIDLSHEPDLGYVFYPAAKNSFGGVRFDVIFHEQPTLRHYDPERVQATIAGQLTPETIHLHFSSTSAQFRLCPGRIVVTDRVGKQVSVFCFGGDLQVVQHPPKTVCVFQSSSPILDLTTYHSAEMLFANEVEILLAQRRAAWLPQQPFLFEQRLAQVDPALLYMVCLHTVATKFRSFPHMDDPAYQEVVHLLHEEMKVWQSNGRWPATLPTLAELL